MILAEKIMQLRKKNGWSQEALAEKLNVSRQSVSKWEGAQSVPELDKIIQLAALFGVSTDFLLKDELEEAEYVSGEPDADRPQVRRVSMEEANAFLDAKKQTTGRTAFAVFLCVLSPLCMLLLGAASEQPRFGISENLAGGVGLLVLLVLVAVAVAIFLSCGMKTSRFAYLDKEDIETAYGVAGMVRDRLEKSRATYTKYNIIGTCTCILSIVPLLTAAFLTEEDLLLMVALSVTMVLAGIGAMFFILAGIPHASMQKLLEEGDYTKQAKRRNGIAGIVAPVYWLLVVAGYLAYSLSTNNWGGSWVVWPVAGVVFAAIMTFLRLFSK